MRLKNRVEKLELQVAQLNCKHANIKFEHYILAEYCLDCGKEIRFENGSEYFKSVIKYKESELEVLKKKLRQIEKP